MTRTTARSLSARFATAVMSFVAALALSIANASNAAHVIMRASSETGLHASLLAPIIGCSVLCLLFGMRMGSPKAVRQRRWAAIGSALVVIPTLAVVGTFCLVFVLGARTNPHAVGFAVIILSPAVAAGAVLATVTVRSWALPRWAYAGALLLLSATPVLLAVARVLLVP
ncbi:hypothetical protein [Curtobacterium sp. MCBA15_001]|uniref:hypothetical protein n=1 Tax=Curtobacterium sp. MCBA15_001 TaxID=1898731 RepID=UPI0008DDFA4F|nr:hypothetical protein [Curtobacterium sp. MCBA15_001]OIH97040.1 hypothetical protein BIU90_16325 [Curtobacterium sp. MCBA15_001]